MGCFKGLIKLVFFLVFLVVVLIGWIYRREIGGAITRLVGGKPTDLPAVARPDIGAPTEAALAAARAKLDSLGRQGRAGRDSVILDANQTASLVGAGLDWSVRRTFDSLRVELQDDYLVVHARLQTDRLPADALGPVKDMVDPVEPIRIGGKVRVNAPMVADFMVEQFQLGTFPFPKPVIDRLVPRMGGNRDGSFPIAIPPQVGGIRVTPAGVVVYRMGI
jgi:hypothetical protein